MDVLERLTKNIELHKKSFAVLIDPDKVTEQHLTKTLELAQNHQVDHILVGGSLITTDKLEMVINFAKHITDIPIILFPGNNLHIHSKADAILFLSLISGRNPDFLIGQHVVAAPILQRTKIQIIPTGYMLVDCGKQTTVSYISNTTPLPYDKSDVAACTALAGQMLGLKFIYMDGGSGAQQPISNEMIHTVKKTIKNTPLIIGGGINTPQKATEALKSGADMIVIGNGIEKDPELIPKISEIIQHHNTQN